MESLLQVRKILQISCRNSKVISFHFALKSFFIFKFPVLSSGFFHEQHKERVVAMNDVADMLIRR
jgi:hypothetical protein